MNPSNQPEPNQFNKKAFLDAAGKVVAQRAEPDAQAEVGLRNQLLTLKDRDGQYVVGSLLAEDPMRLHALIDFIQADKSAAVVKAITRIYTVKTEGLFDDGDLFIKRAPVDQEIINMLGYETFKAIQEAADAHLQPPTAGEVQNNDK